MRRHARAGYTLMEMVVALGVSALLLGSLASAVVVAANALPGAEGSATESVLETSGALDEVISDLERAVYAPERAATAATVVLPDSGSDGAPELLRYAWAGSGGDPVTRVENGGDAESVLGSADGFALGYDTVARIDTYAGATITNTAQVDARESASDPGTIALDKGKAFSLLISPALPVGVGSWRATSVEVYARQQGLILVGVGGQTTLQIRGSSGGEPTGSILATVTRNEASLPLVAGWTEFEFADPPTLDAGSVYMLVFGNSSDDATSAVLTSEQSTGRGLLEASVDSASFWSGGGTPPSWSQRSGREVLFRLHGEYETQNPDIEVTRRHVTRFTVDVTSGGASKTTLVGEARALNSPEVLGALWDVDFSSDPTALDLNADGTPDWALSDASAFSEATLDSGVWKANKELVAKPDTDLTRPTIVDVEWRCVTTGSPGVYFFVAADQGGGSQAVLAMALRRRDATHQRLMLHSVDGDDVLQTLADVSFATDDFLDTRLVIDPASDSVVLEIDGAWIGTYEYHRRGYRASEREVRIAPLGAGVEVDRVRVRMGVAP